MKCLLCRFSWIILLLADRFVTFASVYNSNAKSEDALGLNLNVNNGLSHTANWENELKMPHENDNLINDITVNKHRPIERTQVTEPPKTQPQVTDEHDNESNSVLPRVDHLSFYPEEGDNNADLSILRSLKKSMCLRRSKSWPATKESDQNIYRNELNSNGIKEEIPTSKHQRILKENNHKSSIKLQEEIKLLYPNINYGSVKVVNDDINYIEPDKNDKSVSETEVNGKANINRKPIAPRKTLTIPDCSADKNKRNPILIVSTLDGQISGINYYTGAIVWSYQTGTTSNALLSSSISRIEITSRGEWVRLIPSLDGGIYRFDGENVEPLPVTAETLLHSSFQFNEDTIFTGGKQSQVIGLSPATGEVRYVCDINGCPQNPLATSSNEILVIKRVSQTVRAIDPKTGSERWNFSVGQHELNLVPGDCDSLSEKDDESSPLPQLKFVLPDSIIKSLQNENVNMAWQQKLSSPIVSAWSFSKGQLEEIDLFSSASIPALVPQDEIYSDVIDRIGNRQPSLYVGIHRQQLYIQQNGKYRKKVNSDVKQYTNVVNGASATDVSFPRVKWQPYLATALSRTPVVHHNTNKHPLLLDYDRKQRSNELVIKHNLDYPYDNGYYLYGSEESLFNDSDHWTSQDEGGDYTSYFSEPDTISKRIYYYCFEIGPQFWWEALKWTGAYLVCHFVFLRIIFRKIRQSIEASVERRSVNFVRVLLHNVFRENRQVLAILEKFRVIVPALPPAESVEEEARTSSSGPEGPLRQDSSFSSRYSTDFEPISCLGKGGFGVVFHVKNKLDENEYAIKRIVLPSKESSAERVKREVRALAKLNHPNIVRYYNSWLETPPPGWEHDSDFWWRGGEAASSSMLSPYPDESEAVIFSGRGNPSLKKDVIFSGRRNPSLKKESLAQVIKKLNPLRGEQDMIVDSFLENHFSGSQSDHFELESEDDDEDDDTSEESDDENQGKDDSIEFKDDSIVFKDDSIVFEDDSFSASNLPSDGVELITKTDYGKLTCITVNTKYRSNRRSTSFCEVSHLKRRRTFSQRSSTSFEPLSRPTSLDLIFPNTDLEPKKESNSKRKEDIADNNNDVVPLVNPRTYMYIQMELCQKESLKDWLLNNTTKRDINEVCSIFNNIVSAVEYVHDQFLMHRDLKPSNIFFSLDGEIKIGDFGLVTNIEEETTLTPIDPDLTVVNSKQRTLNAGTHLYMSTEQMFGLPYNYKVDIFSLGLIFFEMLVPFTTEMERRTLLLQVREQKFPLGFSDDFPQENDLLNLMLHKDPTRRLTTRGIRSRKPLSDVQRDLDSIKPEEHFNLTKMRGHSRSHSGTLSFSSSVSSS